MTTKKELREKLEEAKLSLRNITNGIEKDETAGNEITEDRIKEQDDAISEVERLNDEIEVIEKREKEARERAEKAARLVGGSSVPKLGKEDKEMMRRFDMKTAIRSIVDRDGLQGVELEVHDEAKREMSHLSGAGSSQILIPSRFLNHKLAERTDIDQTTSGIEGTQVADYVDALRESAVYSQVGMRIVDGLTDDFKIPVMTQQSLAWASAENSAATDGGSNFAKDTLSPVRLTGFVDVSNELVHQNSGALDSVMRDLGRETASKIDAAMFSTASVTNAPTSIPATSGVGTFTEATPYAANTTVFSDFVKAEQTLADAEGLSGNLAYVAATNLLSELKKSAQVSNVNPAITGSLAYNQQMINGYRTFYTVGATKTTGAGASGDFIFGDFSKVYVGFFGGLAIQVDPYTVNINAQTRLVVHRWVDWSLVQGGAMVKATSLVV